MLHTMLHAIFIYFPYYVISFFLLFFLSAMLCLIVDVDVDALILKPEDFGIISVKISVLSDVNVVLVSLHARCPNLSFFVFVCLFCFVSFLPRGKNLIFGNYATFLCIALMANCMSCKYI